MPRRGLAAGGWKRGRQAVPLLGPIFQFPISAFPSDIRSLVSSQPFSLTHRNGTMVSSVTSETNYFICVKTGRLKGEFFLKKDKKRQKCGFLPHLSATVGKRLQLCKLFGFNSDIFGFFDRGSSRWRLSPWRGDGVLRARLPTPRTSFLVGRALYRLPTNSWEEPFFGAAGCSGPVVSGR